MSFIDEYPKRMQADSIIAQSMHNNTRDDVHRAMAAEMKLWELENKVTHCKIGESVSALSWSKEMSADAKEINYAKQRQECKHNRHNGQSKCGHMNIVQLKTVYVYMLMARQVKTIPFGADKDKALAEIIRFRNEHRRQNGYPPANY